MKLNLSIEFDKYQVDALAIGNLNPKNFELENIEVFNEEGITKLDEGKMEECKIALMKEVERIIFLRYY